MYYHEAHIARQLLGEDYKKTELERLQLLKKKFPNYKHWSKRLIKFTG